MASNWKKLYGMSLAESKQRARSMNNGRLPRAGREVFLRRDFVLELRDEHGRPIPGPFDRKLYLQNWAGSYQLRSYTSVTPVEGRERLLATILAGGRVEHYAWPGGYQILYVTGDNGVLCPKCVEENQALVMDSTQKDRFGRYEDPAWAITAWFLHEEGIAICEHCNTQFGEEEG